MFKINLLIIFHFVYVFGEIVNYNIKPNEPYQGIIYPEDNVNIRRNVTKEWHFTVEDNSTIKVICNDFRMSQNYPWTDKCSYVFLTFLEGEEEKKVCSTYKERFTYVSKGPKLAVKLVTTTKSLAIINCTAYSNQELESIVIDLQPNGRVQYIGSPPNSVPNFSRVWILRSLLGSRISMQCQSSLTKSSPCHKDVMIIDNGTEEKEYCGGKDFTVFSRNNYAKIKLLLNEIGDMKAKCIVQAVTGSNANQYLNVVSEEVDSSEHGVTQGTRATSCPCGWSYKPPGARIFNGKEAGENEFPWMVYVSIKFRNDDSVQQFSCGGSIITKRHMLTAAHCVVKLGTVHIASPLDVMMMLGEHDIKKFSGAEKVIYAEKIFVHDNYLKSPKFITHDIAVILTRDNIEFNQFIGPICLTPDNNLPIFNKPIHVMGWGKTESGKTSDVLLKAKTIVIDNLMCGAPNWELCTNSRPSSTCAGDSGGPLTWLDPETNRFTLISLISRGSSDCQSAPTFSTLVPYFYDWINEIISKSDPSAQSCHKI